MKDRITIVLGAGTMCDMTEVSTSSLTKKIIKKCQEVGPFSKSDKSLVEAIIENARNIYPLETEESAYPMNFEEIFHVLELIPNYLRKQGLKAFVSPYHIFTYIKEEFSGLTNEKVLENARIIIDTINDEIYSYDRLFPKNGQAYCSFFNQLIKESECYIDVFNLNYDTWMEQSLAEYNDGFVDIPGYEKKMKRFDIREYYKKDGRNTVSHLHGQILFEYPEFTKNDINKYSYQDPKNLLYKYANYKQAKDFRKRSARSDDHTQSGENIFRFNLITGLMKTDKLLWNPMAAYHNRLMNSLMENSRLILIGYGFGDIYINSLLEQYNAMHYNDRKVVMIDYVKCNEENIWKIRAGNSFLTLSAKTIFAKRIFHRGNWCHTIPEKDIYYSDDNNACICIRGFRDAIEKHIDEILEVLR